MADGRVDIEVVLDDSGIKTQVKKLDRDLANVGKQLPKSIDKGATGVEKRTTQMRGNVKNVLAMSERDAFISGNNFSKNLATPIGKTSESIIKQYKATGQGISAPIITASYEGSKAQADMLRKTNSGLNKFVGAAKKGAVNVGNQFKAIGPTMINVSDKIGGSVKRGITAPFKGAIGMVKQYGALVGIMGAGAMVKAGLDRLSAIEDARISLKVMMGDAKKADAFMDDVLAFAKTTPFAFPQLATAAKNMVAFGMDTEKVIPTMKAIGDAAAASGKGAEGLDMITAAFGDMQLSGKVSLDQINRLTGNGVNALTMLANHYGVSIDDMRKKISKGAVGSQEAIDILVDGIQNGTKGVAGETAKMGGIMEEMKDSWRGSLDSLKSAISSTMANILKPAIPHIRNFMKWFGEQFKKLPDLINKAVEIIKPIFDKLLPVFKGIVGAVKDQIIPAIINMAPMVTPIIVGILGAFKLLGDFIVNIVAPAFQRFGQFVQENQTLMQALVIGVVALVGSLWAIGQVMPLVLGLMNAFKAFKAAQGILAGIRAAMIALNMTFLANPIVLIIAAIVAAVAVAAFLIYKYWDQIKAGFFVAWNAIKVFGLAIWDGLKETWRSVAKFAISVWGGVTKFFKTLWNQVSIIFKTAWNLIKNNFTAVVKTFQTIVKTGFNLIKTIIATVFLTIWYLITGQWDKIGTVFKAAGNKIKSIMSEMWNSLKNIWSKWMSNLVSILVTFGANVASRFSKVKADASKRTGEMVAAVVKFFTQLPQKAANALVRLLTSVNQKWTKLKSDAKQVGSDMIQGLINGITNMGAKVASKIVEVVGGAINAAKKFLGIASPSKVTTKIGVQTGQGFANGVKSTAKQAGKSAKNVADEAMKNLKLKLDTKKISLQTYINELEKLRKQYKLTADQARKVEKEIYNAQQKIKKEEAAKKTKGASEAIKNAQSDYKLGKIDEKQYISALKKIRKEYKLTGDQARKVNQEIHNANKKIKKDEADRAKSIKKINDDVKKVNDNYLNKVKQINSKLKKDIKDLQDNYKKELKDLTSSIYNQTGLFDEVKSEKVSGDTLLKNIKDQNTQFKSWQDNLAKLEKNGANKKFVDELREMGVGAADEIEAIANLPKDKLAQYIKEWKKKHKAAEEEATRQMAKEKEKMEKQIKTITDTANKELSKAKTEWQKNLSKIAEQLKKLGGFKNSGEKLGKNTVQGLINGLKTMKGPLAKEVNKLAKTIEKEVKKALKIKSPSQLMRDDVGQMLPQGIIEGIDDKKRKLQQKTNQMAEWATRDVTGFVSSFKGMSAPIGNIYPNSVVTASAGNSGGSGSGVDVNHLNKLTDAITQLASRPVKVGIDGREFINVTIDDYANALEFKASRKNKFK